MSVSRVDACSWGDASKTVNSGSGRKDVPATALLTLALLATVSPIGIAVAQQAKDTAPLPPLSVEAQQPKKKAAAPAAKKAGDAPAAPTPPAPKSTTNPYANPDAPYKVEQSASGKLTEPLANTARSVTAVPKEVIDDMGARDLRDLARSVPGLTIGTAEGGNAYGAFAIRGFKANNDIFVDNIRNPGNLIPELFSIQQVEIYKGPSSGIAGRNTIGGAVNIISKHPDLKSSFYETSTTVGTDHTFRTTIDVNQVVTPNLAVRANIMYDTHDVAGRDVTDSERWGGLISATGRFSESVTVTLDYYRYRNNATPDWGVPVRDIDNVPVTEPGSPLKVSRDTWVGMQGLDFFKESADIFTGTVKAKLTDGVTLVNRTRVGESRLNYVATSMEGVPDVVGFPGLRGDVHHPQRDQTSNIYANQTELTFKFSTGTFHHKLVAGVEVTREEIQRDEYLVSNLYDNLKPAPPANVQNPNARPFPTGLYNPLYTDVIQGKGRLYDATIDTVGVYLTDTVHLSKELIVNAGFRYDSFERDQVGGKGNTGLKDPAANSGNVTADLFSWHASILYKPTRNSSFYVAYATSQSPIGSELDSTGAQYNGLGPTLVNVPPQEARSIEVGTKWSLFDGRLLATAALFRTDVDNARTNDGTLANSFSGKYRVQGLELGVAGNITRSWSVYGGFVVLDTEVLMSGDTKEIGRRLANIPLVQFSLLSRHQLTERLAVAGSATFGGEVYGGHLAANAFNNHTVDWWRFDAFAEYKLSPNMTVTLSGLNLTNELYYDAIYQAQDTFAFVAPGRAGYLTVKWKY